MLATSRSSRDETQFDVFVLQHFDSLCKSLASITLDRELAADAAQEAFLQLYLRWSELGQLDDPVAWLYRVGINRCLDHRRYLARFARLLQRLVDSQRQDAVDEWCFDADFASTLRGLPKQQRVAAVLYYQADLSTPEIARVMQISEGAVKSHLHRARETLRVLLGAK